MSATRKRPKLLLGSQLKQGLNKGRALESTDPLKFGAEVKNCIYRLHLGPFLLILR